MALAPGTRLGPYEITAQIGVGGMGEVYQATDTKLKRQVAIKVLPESVAADKDRLARFQREAEVLASLNHPHIAAIYGLEDANGGKALVMELVEGEDLAERLKRGAIPVDEAIAIAKQIAEALESAHEHGIIHRDLKPANVKVREDGTVKVLDFGLAKALEGDSTASAADSQLSHSPTMSRHMTEAGMILGTAAYMSPEQARGKAVDRRADIWAFGVVVFEMLTGQRAFPGEDATDTLAAVVRSEPSWEALPEGTPSTLVVYLRRCLHKDPRQRIHDIADVRLALEGAFETVGPQAATAVAAARPAWRQHLPAAMTAVVAVIGCGLAAWSLWPRAEVRAPPSVTRFYDELPEGQGFRAVAWPLIAVSADGNQLVYNTTAGLSLRSLGELKSRIIPGTEEPLTTPFFSPDREWLGYWSSTDRVLKRIHVSGGTPKPIAEVPFQPMGARWGLDDEIVYAQPGGIWRVSANGGVPDLLVERSELGMYRFPQMLPDGESVLFVRIVSGISHVEVQRASGERKSLVEGDRAVYLSSGHLIVSRNSEVSAALFDVDAVEVVGREVPVAQAVSAAGFDISDSGTLVYVEAPDRATTVSQLVLVDRSGGVKALSDPGRYLYPRFSPDGTRIAVQRDDESTSNIFVFDIARRRLEPLTFSGGTVPLWTPDGSHITFLSGEALWSIPSDFTGRAGILSVASPEFGIAGPYSWSPDAGVLFWDGAGGVAQLTPSPDGRAQHGPLLNEPYSEAHAGFSPDGKWFSYRTNESGNDEVYVHPYPMSSGSKRQISTTGGDCPVWARAGRELFYTNDGRLWAVEIATTPSLAWKDPVPLFETPWQMSVGAFVNYDVAPDGRQFVVLQRTEAEDARQPSRPRVVVVKDWFEELKRLVPKQ